MKADFNEIKRAVDKYSTVITLIFVIVLGFNAYYSYKFFVEQDKLAESCGFEQEEFRCYCDAKTVHAYEALQKNDFGKLNLSFNNIWHSTDQE